MQQIKEKEKECPLSAPKFQFPLAMHNTVKTTLARRNCEELNPTLILPSGSDQRTPPVTATHTAEEIY